MSGWRALGLFWLAVLVTLGAGGAVLQYLGPPPPQRTASARPGPAPSVKPADEPVPAKPDMQLRLPMQSSAAAFDRSTRRPWVGLLLAGVGLNLADSERAVKVLPGGVTLVVSPYAANPGPLLAAARLAGHEYLVAIPMEPQGYPLNDPGNHALMTTLPPEQNRALLDWVLARIDGYVGATAALGTLRGERFVGMQGQMAPVLATLAERGLLYVDPRPDAPRPPYVWSRGIDIVVDEPATHTEIDAKLDRLERLAHDKGSALGLVTAVRPVAIDRIAAWASGLAGRGVALAPVSALVEPPPDKETAAQ